MVSSDVASTTTKALGEGTHQNVNITRVHPPVVTHTPPRLPNSTNAVGFVQVEIGLREHRQTVMDILRVVAGSQCIKVYAKV